MAKEAYQDPVPLLKDQKDANQEALEAIMELAGGDQYSLDVKKKDDDTSRFGFLQSIDVQDFSYEWLAAEYGGGEYLLQVRQYGKFIPGKSVKISVHESVEGRLQKKARKKKEEAAERFAHAGGGDSGQMIELLKEVLEKQSDRPDATLAMMKAQSDSVALMMQQGQQQQQMMMQMMGTMMEQSTKLQIAMMGSKPQNDVASLVGALSPIMQSSLKTSAAGGGGSLRESIETIAMIREMFGSEEKEPSTFDKITNLLGDGVSAYLASKGINPMQSLPEGDAQALPAAQSPENPNQLTQEKVNELLQKLKNDNLKHLPRLCKAADANRSPAGIAEMIVDTITPEEAAVLGPALSHPEWMTLMFDKSPEVEKRLTWFEGLRQAIRDELGMGGVDAPTGVDAENQSYDNGLMDGVKPPTTTTLEDDTAGPQHGS